VRLATFNADLSRAAPGLLLRDLTRGDADAERVAAIVKAVRPDILLITKFDHDPRGRALKVFRDLLRAGKDGIDYPHLFAGPVNAGVPSGHDLDRDGKLMGWNDGFGFGRFPGEGGMAILSRHRLDEPAHPHLPRVPVARPARPPDAGASRQHALADGRGAGGDAAVVPGALGRAGDPARRAAAAPARLLSEPADLRRRGGHQPAAQSRRDRVLGPVSRRHGLHRRPGPHARRHRTRRSR
jgi:hypothetical protein